MQGKQVPRHAIVLLIVAGLVVALTTLPASVLVIAQLKYFTVIAGHPNANDALGHASLYGLLTAVIYWALRERIGFARAFWVALISALCLGLTTELLQQFSPGRDVQLSDLLGNWLGAMTTIALISFGHTFLNERLHRPA